MNVIKNTWGHFRKALYVIAFMLMIIPAYSFAFNKPYSHYSSQEDISSVLADFARQQGYSVNVSPSLTGKVNGRFENIDPDLFIDGMKTAFGVCYYIKGKNIYFYSDSELTQSVVKPSALSAQELLNEVRASGLISANLPVRINSNGMLSVSGPQSYVDTIVDAIRQFDVATEEHVVMKVIRLKHAKAEDIEVSSSDRNVHIPGVASILQSMVSGGSNNIQGSGVTVTQRGSALQGLRGSGLIKGSQSSSQNSLPSDTSIQSSGSVQPRNLFSPSIIADSRLNAVIIHDYDYRMPYYEDVIKELDVPVRLVELHAAIVDVDVGAADSLGIDWQAARRTGNWQIAGGVGHQISNSGSLNPNGGGIFSTVFSTDQSAFMMQVNMLEEDNKARTLGRPSVLTLDNVEATLEDTTTNYVKVAGNESSDLFEVVSGTILRVTPHIIDSHDGSAPYIQMVISLQTNQDTDQSQSYTVSSDAQGADERIPVIKKTTINTQALVQQGQSLLLGGYYMENHRNSDNGIPVLKDIPLIGGLFGSSSDEATQRERLLLITPRILDLDDINLPSGLDDKSFAKSPTQADYSMRETKPLNESGCASSRSSSANSSTKAQLVKDI